MSKPGPEAEAQMDELRATGQYDFSLREEGSGDFDFFLYMPEDVTPSFVSRLMETSAMLRHKAIVVASVADSTGKIIFGGLEKGGKVIIPDPAIPLPCYSFDRMVLLIPKAVENLIGLPESDNRLSMSRYSFRARKEEITKAVAPGIAAILDSCQAPEPTSILDRLYLLFRNF